MYFSSTYSKYTFVYTYIDDIQKIKTLCYYVCRYYMESRIESEK